MTKKGLIKLVTQPHVFARDYIKKKRINFPLPSFGRTVNGEYRYTIVSAVYNVAPYLDDYFKSLVNQSLDFKKHIFLILVDDGSPDGSAQIIKKWQKKYPNNITYVKKENGGQASARNVGLAYVNTEWVTFIDPDDFVNKVYFEEIDRFLGRNRDKSFSMVSNNFIFYYEDKKKYSDTHPLNYRFTKVENIVHSSNMDGNIQMSVCTAIFRKSIIQNSNLIFNEEIKPSFEDANFILKYILYSKSFYIAFLKQPIYYYRKRSVGGSTLDTAWENPKTFDELIQYGCVDLFTESIQKIRYVPQEQQKAVLYHLIWQFKRIVNNSSSVSFLSDIQLNRYKSLLKETFEHISIDTIEKFNLAGAWFYHKIALLGMYKNYSLNYQIVYVDDYDSIKREVKLRYFTYFDSSFIFTLNNKEVLPSHAKVREHEFLGELFIQEHILWFPVSSNSTIDVYVDNKNTSISFDGKQWSDGLNIDLISIYFNKNSFNFSSLPSHIRAKRKLYQSSYFSTKFKDSWLFMDRIAQGDDNAEHLYRYIQKNYPKVNIHFIIEKGTSDWFRLEQDNFSLIPFASSEHEASLIHAKHMISSDASKECTNYLETKYYGDLLKYKFTFLQHGVTKDDLSLWLNSKNIDCFITAAQREYDSIAKDSKYKFSSKEVVLTGFPRHDALINKNKINNKTIMVMPTWRSYLNNLSNSSSFQDTKFAKAWISLLHSNFLKELYQKDNYTILFFPHPNIKKFINALNLPDYIQVLDNQTESIQLLFQTSDLLLTDYSSVAFEMAILKKHTIYYQFDHKEIFSGTHTYEKGYFDYEKDAFGPICYDIKDISIALNNFLETGDVDVLYKNRMENFFAYHDTNNCKRVFEAIESLYDIKRDEISDELLLEKAKDAKEKGLWKAVEGRYELLLDRGIAPKDTLLILSKAKYFLGELDDSTTLLQEYIKLEGKADDIKEFEKRIDITKKLFSTLEKEELSLLINNKKDFFSTLQFNNIKKIFKEDKWSVLSVACEVVNIESIEKENRSEFYYMYGRSLRLLNQKDRALKVLATSLSYNNMKPNASLWEYSSTLYELYNEEDITKDLILKEFEDNGYIVKNINLNLIESWFDQKHYKQVSVAFELIDIEIIKKDKIDRFYYMWGKTLFEVGRYKDSIEKFKHTNSSSREILTFNAKSMTYIETWEESYALWLAIYKKYPTYNSAEVLKNIIWALKHLDREDELQEYKNRFLKWKFLNSSDSDIEILNTL